MKRLTKSEIIFKVLSYGLLLIFSICCIYPLWFTLMNALSEKTAVDSNQVLIWVDGLNFKAFREVLFDRDYWTSYSNTIFYTVYGTAVSMFVAITGAYALSKPRLIWGRGFNFLLVFTMWFSAGMIPTYQNFQNLNITNRFGFIVGMGFNAFNIVLLRNYFSGVPHEIEEAATIDGANEFQILTKIYIPMSKSSIATVTMFYALNRWNTYFWAMWLLDENEQPLQVYMRRRYDNMLQEISEGGAASLDYSIRAVQYAMIICSIIPICIVYPQLQKYFAAGVNVGGVKE